MYFTNDIIIKNYMLTKFIHISLLSVNTSIVFEFILVIFFENTF